MKPFRLGVLGATGLVGQRLIDRLDGHPWFRVTALAASERSADRRYAEAVRWRLPGDPPADVGDLTLRRCVPDQFDDCDVVVSGLDSEVARDLEPRLAETGLAVISNSSAYRMHEDVPILVPEVNASHAGFVERQRQRNGGGFIVTNPNCSTTGLVLALAPLVGTFGVRRVIVSTLQALSGAGAEGPRALDFVDNVVPYIPGEEEKMEVEVGKILGRVETSGIVPAEISVSAHCHRVGTLDGHLEAVSVELERSGSLDDVRAAFESFRGETEGAGLPSAPECPLVVRSEPDRPQPRLDRDTGNGMSVVIGRVRPCPVMHVRFVLLSHNTVRGAAGGTVFNAELLASRDLLPRRGRD